MKSEQPASFCVGPPYMAALYGHVWFVSTGGKQTPPGKTAVHNNGSVEVAIFRTLLPNLFEAEGAWDHILLV